MIDFIGGFLQRNLIVFLAVVILPLKLIVVRISRDPEAEGAALLSVPEDLCYVILGLILGDVTKTKGSFRRYFAYSSRALIDIIVAVGLNLGIALFIHRLAQWTAKSFKNWRASNAAREAAEQSLQQMELPLGMTTEDLRTLMNRHLFVFLVGYGAQLLLVLIWLHWVSKVISTA